MIDPLAQIVSLLRPTAPNSKRVSGAGRWRFRRPASDTPYFCVVLEGKCLLSDEQGHERIISAGDFLLAPSGHSFEISGAVSPAKDEIIPAPTTLPDGEIRHGDVADQPEVSLLVGNCEFGSPDASLLASLLPTLIHVRGEERLKTLVMLVSDEVLAQRPAREVMLERLLEALFIEAVRSSDGPSDSPGLMRGLADRRLASCIRGIHEMPGKEWTIETLAQAASLSRSAFFQRFQVALGRTPMEYLLTWRMVLAKRMLRDDAQSIAEIADQLGYSSASTFTAAFTRHVGCSPRRHARWETRSALSRGYRR